MKNLLIVLLIIIVVIIIFVGLFIGRYNRMQQLRVNIDQGWADVQTQLMRRFDLIPNLVETVRGYAAHEQETFRAVTEARARVGGIMEVSEDLLNDPEAFQRFQEAQNTLAGAVQRLLMVTEAYPELKANQNFIRLQDELAGTENRIAVERRRFNEAVGEYNRTIVVFPNNMIAGMFNLERAQFFEAPEETQVAPTVEF
ncbi:MAG: LemA family protein [Candidatus Cloacimonetes bacterium]|nr:LemA family protein [Candidatus Cloacimonadota bacterium]